MLLFVTFPPLFGSFATKPAPFTPNPLSDGRVENTEKWSKPLKSGPKRVQRLIPNPVKTSSDLRSVLRHPEIHGFPGFDSRVRGWL